MQQPLEQAVAETILQRFESFYSRFLEITQGSKSRFENSDWLGCSSPVESASASMITMSAPPRRRSNR
jgi:isocitrate dehydrogenase kinase/phosphatase